MPRKLEDITGKKFTHLMVLKHAGMIPSGQQKQSSWLCLCDCGKEVVVSNNNLKRSNTKSCGCHHVRMAKEHNLKEITNQRFGMLVALEYVETRNKNAHWKCICDCGNEAIIAACALKNGQKSCGCRQGNFIHGEWSKGEANYARYRRRDPLFKLKHNVSTSIRAAIKSKNGSKAGQSTFQYLSYTARELKEHLEAKFEPWMNWDNYGEKSNSKRKTWHIDHIKPHCNFPYKSLDDPLFRECWSLDNIRPLEKLRNFSEGARSA